MKKAICYLVVMVAVACAGTTLISPEIEIDKDGSMRVSLEAKITKTASTSTAAGLR